MATDPRAGRGNDSRMIGRRALIRKGLLVGVGGVVSPSLLAACARGESGSAAVPTTGPTPTATSGAAGTPRRGGTLSVGTTFNPVGFDPYFSRQPDATVSEHLYTRLINYDVVGSQLVPTPDGLASWELAADGMSATLVLREGQIFHSGAPVTADDLVGVFDRATSDDGGPLGSSAAQVASAERLDDLTAQLTLSNPMGEASFTDMLAVFKLVEHGRNSSDELAGAPAGSGPFRLVDFQPGAKVALERFEDYYDSPRPYLDRIDFTIFDSPDTMVSALESGEVDLAWYVPARAAETLGGDFQVANLEGPSVIINATMNPTVAPFDDRLVRQAMQRAVNRERINSDVFFGFGRTLELPFDHISPVYGDSTTVPETSFDLDEAKTLLQEAGSPPGAQAIVNAASPEDQLMMQIIQSDLKSIGFDLQIQTVETQTYIERILSGDYGFTLHGQGSDLRTPAARLSKPANRIDNSPLWGDDVPVDYASAMRAAAAAPTDEDLRDASAEIRRVMVEEAWVVGIVTRPDLMAASPGVHDFARYAGASPRPYLAYTWRS